MAQTGAFSLTSLAFLSEVRWILLTSMPCGEILWRPFP